ncbi:MAG: hypothetical protein WCC36_17280 [Gammaproteobacteria bacterium]
MIVHCTQKLAAKLPEVSTTPLSDANPLGSWHANLYIIDRRQCVMFCHDRTRFVLFVPGLKKKDFAHLDFWFADLFANTLLKLGYGTKLIDRALSHVDALRFDTVCDRSVHGSMNTVKWQDLDAIMLDVPNVMDLPLYSVSARLNERPVHIKGMKTSECLWPDRAMRELIRTLD